MNLFTNGGTWLLVLHVLISLLFLKMMWGCINNNTPLIRSKAFKKVWVLFYFIVTMILPVVYVFIDKTVTLIYLPVLIQQAIQAGIEIFSHKKLQQGRFHRFFIAVPLLFVFARTVFTAYLISVYSHAVLYIILFAHILDFQFVIGILTRYLLDDAHAHYSEGGWLTEETIQPSAEDIRTRAVNETNSIRQDNGKK